MADPFPIERTENGRFAPGWRPPTAFTPGQQVARRPKNSVGGRAAALQWLDEITKELKVADAIKKALREEGLKHPLRYFKEILMPLVPKEMLLRVGAEQGGMTWVSYLTSNLTEPSSSSPAIDVSDSAPSAVADAGERLALPPPSCSTSPDKPAEPSRG